jgi:RNA recognition motif-containing protein
MRSFLVIVSSLFKLKLILSILLFIFQMVMNYQANNQQDEANMALTLQQNTYSQLTSNASQQYDDEFNKMVVNPIMHLIDLDASQIKNQFNNVKLNSQQRSMSESSSVSMLSSQNEQPLKDRSIDRTKLFIGNLPSSTRLCELVSIFKKYGRVNEKLSVVKDQNYAFIHFYNEKDAEIALNELNDSLFKDRYIRVQYSTSTGHVKKSKTMDFSNRSSLCFTTPLPCIPSQDSIPPGYTSAHLTRSTTDFTINSQQSSLTSNYLRPITGGNRRIPNTSQSAHFFMQSYEPVFNQQFTNTYLSSDDFTSRAVGGYSVRPMSSLFKSNTMSSFNQF